MTHSKPSFTSAILYLGLLSSLVTLALSAYALKYLEATKVGLFSNVATVVTILAGMFFLQEKLFYYHYIGIIAILAGTIGFNTVSKAHSRPEI
ncbi:DMT family transporter [Clostridium sp. C105KSO13]|uniref:DMT family transporter n=1 Tax=Clostridium sp. C105KSO13 TaxID=1776045 RepID=UPI0007406AA0|nr:DMT family transporter [Clostridium sp. C105KSO13]CUX19729.1 EamA-like transporter family protein [Clostridium sp. C105KSO13]